MSEAPVLVEPRAPLRPLGRPLAFSVPKRRGEKNEDSWHFSHKGVGVVSDGASISFDSAAWARLLVRRYAQRPGFNGDWLAAAIAKYAKLHDRDSLPWMQQAAYDRGSFASLLGVREIGNGQVEVLAIGDSLAVLCDGDRIVKSFPYDAPEQFDADPQLLSTNPAENAFLDEGEAAAGLIEQWTFGDLDEPSLLLVTDALGRWILSPRDDQPSPIAALREIRSRRAFGHFVEAEREAGRLRRDDTTLVAYWDLRADGEGGRC